MTLEMAKARLRGCGYQVLPVKGEPLYVVFYPPDDKGNRRTACVNDKELIGLAQSITLPGDERKTEVDIRRIGVIGRLRKVPAGTAADGTPKLQIVLEIEGKESVNSVPIEDLRDMLGELVLLQLNAVQTKLNLNPEAVR